MHETHQEETGLQMQVTELPVLKEDQKSVPKSVEEEKPHESENPLLNFSILNSASNNSKSRAWMR
jgi:hypothetical protein